MFQSISWQQYLIFLLISTIAYYFAVWIVFFKAKFSFLQVRGEDAPDEVMSTAQHIIDEIRPVFINKKNKNELILVLQSTLQKYNQWDEPGFRDTINEFITAQSQLVCSIVLDEEDQRMLWL